MPKPKYIMGIQSFSNQDSGAAIVKCSDAGPEFVAISEERLNRKKFSYTFPVHSIGYCLDHFGLDNLNQIDLLMTDFIRLKRWFNSGPAYNIGDYDYLKMKFGIKLDKIKIISHHMAHAASVYYASGFDDAAILVVDGNGSNLETTSYFKGKGFDIDLLENYQFHGIGACYSAVTKWILGLGTGGEGKTMGLAPYGEKHKGVLKINAELDGVKNNFSGFMKRMPYSDVLNQIDPKNRINPLNGTYKECKGNEELLSPYFSGAAFDVQQETERVLVHLAKDIYKKTGSKNLCIAGGVALNSVSNKIVLDKTDFENIFIFPACSDSGIPFGLALWGYYNLKNPFEKKKLDFRNTYTGKEYSHNYVLEVLKKYCIPYSEEKLDRVAKLIAEGKIVGWFQGGSEYGPRALGHRSIIVDSRSKEMKDILNSRVKHREAFRPYAPSILREHCEEYFDLKCESPYMLLIAEVKKPEVVPAITHVDNTARVQTVTKEANGNYYDLIKEFQKITGVPCILNTSFNDAGEPIVETPEDAIIRFLSTEIDCLAIGNFLLEKEKIDKEKSEKIMKQMMNDREKRIKTNEKELVKKHFKGFDGKEKDRFISESNKASEWHVKYSRKYELEKKVLEWIEGKKKILVIGTKDHTAILPKYINYFSQVNIAGFCNYKDCVDKEKASIPYKECTLKDFEKIDFDEILISSYEYNFEIANYLKKTGIKKPVHIIYDDSSRNFMDIFKGFPEFKD